MSDEHLGVRITADASGVKPGTDKTKAEISSIAPLLMQLNASMQEMTAAMASGFQQIAAGIGAAKTQVRELHEEATVGFGGMIAKIHEGAESVRTFQMRAKEFAEVYVSMFAVERVAEWARALGEAGEQIEHLSKMFGMSVEQVQQLKVVSLSSGVSLEALTRGMALLDKNAATSSKSTNAVGRALQFVGLSANDGMTQMQRLMTIADKFKSMADGPNKTALAMVLLGRSGQQLIPILDRGADGLQELIGKGVAFGAISKEAADKEYALAETVNDSKIAWMGLQNTLADALAPAMMQVTQGLNDLAKSLVESYNNGGAVHQMFDGLKTIGGDLWGVLSGLAPVFVAIANNAHAATLALEALIAVMTAKYAAGVASAIASSRAVTTILFAIEAASAGAATAMEAFTLVAATAGRTLLAAFGGPIGIALIAITAGMYELYTVTDEATEATTRFKSIQDSARDSAQQTKIAIDDLANAHGKAREEAEKEAKAHIANAQAKLKDALASAALAQVELTGAKAAYQEEEHAAHVVPIPAMGMAGIGASSSPSAAVASQAVTQAKANLVAATSAAASLKDQIAKLQAALAAPEAGAGPGVDLSNGGSKDKSKMGGFEEQLAEQKAHYEAAQDQQGSFQKWSETQTAEFWGKIRALDSLSAKDREEANIKYWDAKASADEKGFQGHIAGLQKDLDKARGSGDEQVKIAERIAGEIAAAYGKGSREAEAADDQVIKIKRQVAHEAEALSKEIADAAEKSAKVEMDAAESTAKFRHQMGLITETQLLAIEKDLEDQRYNIDKQALVKRLDAMKADPFHDKVEYQKLSDQIVALDTAYHNKLTANAQRGALQSKQIAQQMFTPFSQEIGKMLTMQETFTSGFAHMWQSLANVAASAIEHMVEAFLEGLIVQDAASGVLHAKEMLRHAEEAAAGAWKAVVGIPIIGPVLAPIAAAAAFAGVMAFSAEGGMGAVPYDNAPFLLHRNEMVLPASLANPLRSMLHGGGSPSAPAAAPAASGGVTLNWHDNTGTLTHQQIMDKRTSLAKALKQAYREGSFSGTPLKF